MRYSPTQQIVRKIASLKKKGFDETSEKIIELNVELEKLRNNYLTTKKERIKYPVKYLSWNKNDQKHLDIISIFELIKSTEINYINYSSRSYRTKYHRNKYTPCGLFYGTNSIRKLNGIVFFQILGKALTSPIRQKLINDEYTFATYYESDEKVTNVFVCVENILPKNIMDYQKEIQEYYQQKLKNVKIIIPDFKIALLLTYDFALYNNKNSTLFKIK